MKLSPRAVPNLSSQEELREDRGLVPLGLGVLECLSVWGKGMENYWGNEPLMQQAAELQCVWRMQRTQKRKKQAASVQSHKEISQVLSSAKEIWAVKSGTAQCKALNQKHHKQPWCGWWAIRRKSTMGRKSVWRQQALARLNPAAAPYWSNVCGALCWCRALCTISVKY